MGSVIGTDKDHLHFLIQSVPMYSPKKIVQIIKSITAREIFARCPELKKQLRGGELWTDGYYISTVGQHGNEQMISKYIKQQGREKEYKQLHNQQLDLFRRLQQATDTAQLAARNSILPNGLKR